MKFESKEDAAMFLLECDRPDLAATVDESFSPDDELVEVFIQRRKATVRHLKDFRRQQITRQQWRHNRYNMMKGIKSFHKSTKGKKFHRALGRFLSTRLPLAKGSLLAVRDIGEASYIRELGEVFKALSSYKTHAWIQFENYMSASDTADYEIFLDAAVEAITKIEVELMKPTPVLDADAVDLVLASLNHNYVLDPLAGDETSFQALQDSFQEVLETNAQEEYPYIATLQWLRQRGPT